MEESIMSESDVTSEKTKKLLIPTHSKKDPNHGFRNEDGEDVNLGEYIKAFEDETNDTTFESEFQDEDEVKSESVLSNVFVTPQKGNVLSPPVVLRRVPENQTPESKPLIPASLFQSTNGSEYLDSTQNNLSGFTLDRITSNAHEEDDEDKEETSSMISQYGSEVGEIKFRMEDINTMDAVPEGANDEDSEDEDGGSDEKVSPTEKEEKLDRGDDGSIDSIDLSNHLENDVSRKQIDSQQNQFRENFTPVSPSSKSVDVASNKHDAPPTTPIGAVSIALRNIGKGMSNMARAGGKLSSPLASSSSPLATVSTKSDERYHLNDLNSHRHWLSPRFGNQRNPTNRESIHQPQLTSVQSSKVKSGATQFFGITQCLSFDPESGKLPYSNMRMTDSPPASPLPRRTHRKTQSWGQGSSDFLSKGASPSFDLGLESSQGRGQIPPIPLTPKAKENMFTSTHMSPRTFDDNEREDAKILLKIFVEQTLMYDRQLSEKGEKSQCNPAGGDFASKKVTKSILEKALRQLRSMSKTFQNEESTIPHQILLAVLDELETSHEYAQEMKQAALSASAWLHSNDTSDFEVSVENSSAHQNTTIDQLKASNESLQRQLSEQYDVNQKLNQDLSICRAEIGRLRSPLSYDMRKNDLFPVANTSVLDLEDDDSSPSSKEDEFSDRHNALPLEDISLEAVEAKKDILLLKAELEETNKILKQMERDVKRSSYDQKKKKEFYKIDQIQENQNIENANDQGETNSSTEVLNRPDQSGNDNDACDSDGDINISALKDTLKTELEEYVSAIQESDRRKIEELEDHIRYLENEARSYVENKSDSANETDKFGWKVLENFAPPPDHELRSPIVSAILSEWNSDKRTQIFLLEWIENMMTCPDPSNSPPLHISGLDDQLRNGFLMHILPFLSKRTDVDVEVSTRRHCKSFYEILINVQKPGDSDKEGYSLKGHVPLTTKSTQMMAFKASAKSLDDSLLESNASSNHNRPFKFGSIHLGDMIKKGKSPPSPKSPSSVDVNNTISNVQETTKTHTPRNSGMVVGALNAVGGLLSRKKTLNVNDPEGNSNFKTIVSPSQPFNPRVKDSSTGGTFDSISNSTEGIEPYHRVVSAPPGRIGITFVQYRGHAMVSDVYPDSPLLGWIFPSDIVIAIDEIPVSGMRVPDIVKLLTNRKERQRALRVISSHAMTDLIAEKPGTMIND